MLKRSSLALMILVTLVGLVAQPLANAKTHKKQNKQRLPQFDDYRVRGVPKKQAQIIAIPKALFNESATDFRQRLRQAAKGHANFAGRYAIVGWSCGMICISLAIVDVSMGKIYDTPFAAITDGPGCPDGFYDGGRKLLHYRFDSKLLVLRGVPAYFSNNTDIHDAACSTRYYVWRKRRLVRLREILPRQSRI